jgi:hypothetical protein
MLMRDAHDRGPYSNGSTLRRPNLRACRSYGCGARPSRICRLQRLLRRDGRASTTLGHTVVADFPLGLGPRYETLSCSKAVKMLSGTMSDAPRPPKVERLRRNERTGAR